METNVIEVNNHIYIHCSDKALKDYLLQHYINIDDEEVSEQERRKREEDWDRFLDDLEDEASTKGGPVHAYLTYPSGDPKDWEVDELN